ncbi:IclR family transcriptional regulator, partial [Bacillaceae bacterium Marseille-Q3522]|nr:IclR family transcriptional regulator [Bacillaceae bacterium Marseille-Q3522]
MQKYHYIDQNTENGKYKLGMKLVERGNFLINSMDLRQVSKKYLVDLSIKTGQTTHLGILDGHEGVYIDKVDGANAVIRYSMIGRRIPLHSTAIGKALLSFQSPEMIEHLLKDYQFVKYADNTITGKEEFLDELDKVRKLGYGLDNQENEPGVRCISVPIQNRENKVIAALSISTLVARVNDRDLQEYITLLKKVGKELSQQLKYTP